MEPEGNKAIKYWCSTPIVREMLWFTFAPMYTLKKSLGQHFLKDENICRKIVDALHYCSFTRLLEVGPGGGALTKHLVLLGGVDFKAVEVDDEKVVFLRNTFPVLKDK